MAATTAGVIHPAITPLKTTHIPRLHQMFSGITMDGSNAVRRQRTGSSGSNLVLQLESLRGPVQAMSSTMLSR